MLCITQRVLLRGAAQPKKAPIPIPAENLMIL